ncbi:hypothetical protein SLA2020_067760 [Shorea laevis]
MPAQQNDPRTRFKETGVETGVGGKGVGRGPGVPSLPEPRGRAARDSSSTHAPSNEPRRGPCQGKPTGRLVPAHAGCVPLATLTKTTLGNGYLGSRIDEEHSEMRYLV